MPFENQQRLTRRRSSAGPTPPRKPLGGQVESGMRQNGGPRPSFLTLRDHGKVYVADLPNLSDGQLSHIGKEADEVLNSLENRITDLEQEATNGQRDNDALIKVSLSLCPLVASCSKSLILLSKLVSTSSASFPI